jgi:hypothetical protein
MEPKEAIHHALCRNDVGLFRATLAQHPELKARMNDPLGPFGSPPVFAARSREMLDAFLEAGADLNARSDWWAGSFGFLDNSSEDLAEYALQKGARLDVHSAARLGKTAELARMLSANPGLVNARGGDGKTPLHFARDVEVARLLVERGANVNAHDIDHESTPAQYHISDKHDLVRYLISQGSDSDIFLAAALGDHALVEKHLAANPECVRMRVNSEWFPMRDPRAGGTIYQWTLGFNIGPHEVAEKFHHPKTCELLMQRSPVEVRFLVHCWKGDEAGAQRILDADPALPTRLQPAEMAQLADAARNNNLPAVRLMLRGGMDPTARGQHDGMPLHWAAWHGNTEMVKTLLAAGAPLEDDANDFKCSPLAWAIHGSENGWHRQNGNYPATVEALIRAGAKIPNRTDGTKEVQDILAQHRS